MSDEKEKEPFQPAFFDPDNKPNVNNDMDKPGVMTWGDYMLQAKGWLNPRHREVCRLWAMGWPNYKIAKALKVSEQWLSIIKSNQRIRQEIEKFQDRMFEHDLDKRMKYLGDDAANVMEEILIDENIKTKDKESAAKWVLEKLTGKPAQAIDMKGEINIGIFMDQLEQMKGDGMLLKGSGARDVTPEEIHAETEEEKEPDPIADWINSNI